MGGDGVGGVCGSGRGSSVKKFLLLNSNLKP
jgi:hypothetical protein